MTFSYECTAIVICLSYVTLLFKTSCSVHLSTKVCAGLEVVKDEDSFTRSFDEYF